MQFDLGSSESMRAMRRSGRRLSEAQVREIRAALKDGCQASEIADEYGVTIQCIWKIKNKITWTDDGTRGILNAE